MRRQKGAPTPEQIKANAQRTYAHFSPTSVRQRLGIGRKDTFFYVTGLTEAGKRMFWGPMTEGLDMAIAAAKGLIEGEVLELETRDLAKAKSEFRAELLSRGKEPDSALERMYNGEKQSKKSLFDRLTRR
jgi:hypothetical protein